MRLFLIILISIAALGVYSKGAGLPIYRDSKYPAPILELKYLNEFFTKELIIQKSFREGQLVPISIELIKPQMSDELNNLYLTIESVRVTFVIKEDGALRTAPYPGHLVLIPISWPSGFTLEQGSRIVFTVKYNYHLKKEVVDKGEIIQEIRF